MTLLNEAKDAEAKGAPVLGARVWWRFPNVEITVNDLKAAVVAQGWDEKLVPIPEPRGAVSDAAKALKVGKANVRTMRHKIDADRFCVSFDLPKVTESGGPVVDVDYKVEQVVEYHYQKQTLTFKTPHMEPEFRQLFQKYLTTLEGTDVNAVCRRVLEKVHALNDEGVWFVPRAHLDTVEKLQQLCQKIPNARFRAPLVLDTPEERRETQADAKAEIEKELALVEQDIYALTQRALEETVANGEHTIRGDTLQRRIEEFQRLKVKAQAYSDLLQFKKEDLDARLTNLQQTVLALI